MTTNGMVWIKHYSTKRTDPRVKLLTLPSKAIYYMLSEVAAQCDADGAFVMNGVQLTDQQIAQLATVEVTDLKTAMREMRKTGLVSANGHGPYLTDFAYEQMSQADRRAQWAASKQRARSQQEVKQDVQQDKKQEVKQDVHAIEEREESELRVKSLLLLSDEHREFIKSKHPEWITEAIALAKKNEKPRPSYIKGILKNWITEGRSKNANSNTTTSRRTTPKQATTPAAEPTAADRAAAARAMAKRKQRSSV